MHQAAPEESLVNSLWKLVDSDTAPAETADGFVRLITDSIAREAGLLNDQLEKYVRIPVFPSPRCPRTPRPPAWPPSPDSPKLGAPPRPELCLKLGRFQKFNGLVYHESVPSFSELRLPPGVALLELRPFNEPGPEVIPQINVTLAERKDKADSCTVS